MKMRGLKNINKARRTVLDSMEILRLLEYDVLDNPKGKKQKRWSGNISLYGGTGYIRNGIIYFNFNQDFYEQLKYATPMDVSKQALQINTQHNPNTFFFLRHISFNYRINENKRRQNTISIETLINKSPELPSYNDVLNSDRAYNRRIVRPTFRDLDAINAISYTVQTAEGKTVEKPHELQYEDFITCKIIIDYSMWPAHPERLERRQQHIERAKEIRRLNPPKRAKKK